MSAARLVVLAAFCSLSFGCTPPPEPPPPPPPEPAPAAAVSDPAPVTEGDITVAYENGLRIVVKQIPAAELVSMQLYVKGGARFRDPATAGVEQLALQTAVSGGTESLDKQAFGKKLSRLGSDLGASTGNEFSVVAAKSLTEAFGVTFGLMAEAFLSPALPENEIAIQREQQIATIKQREETPDGRLHMLVVEQMYEGHPYALLPSGTVESVKSLTREMLRERLQSMREGSRLELVVVGNIEIERVRKLVRQHFGDLPRGDYENEELPKPRYEGPELTVVEAELPTNYISSSFIGPGWDDPDFAASILAMRLLTRRVWEEVRTKRNLSYAPSARYGWSGEITRGSLYVTAVDANTTMRVMLDEVKKLQSELVGDKELAGTKAVFVTSQLMDNESTNGQASWLAICDIVGGDWRLARTLPERVEAVSPEQIRAFAKAHIRGLQSMVLGPASDLDVALFESL